MSTAPLYRVGAVEQDEGPAFHRDLFGGIQEWTRTKGAGAADLDGRFCALRDGSPDFVSFPNENPGYAVVGFATSIIYAVRDSGSAHGMAHF